MTGRGGPRFPDRILWRCKGRWMELGAQRGSLVAGMRNAPLLCGSLLPVGAGNLRAAEPGVGLRREGRLSHIPAVLESSLPRAFRDVGRAEHKAPSCCWGLFGRNATTPCPCEGGAPHWAPQPPTFQPREGCYLNTLHSCTAGACGSSIPGTA